MRLARLININMENELCILVIIKSFMLYFTVTDTNIVDLISA